MASDTKEDSFNGGVLLGKRFRSLQRPPPPRSTRYFRSLILGQSSSGATPRASAIRKTVHFWGRQLRWTSIEIAG
jgi:hypothetical protein